MQRPRGRARSGDAGAEDADEPPRRARAGAGAGASAAVAAARRAGRGERRVLGEDRPLQLAQPLARLDAELVDERAARVLVGLQRVGLAVAAVEREHVLRPQPLAVRVLGDQRVELADHLGVAAEREPRLDELLGDRDPQLLQPRALAVGERRVREVRERRPAPLGERALERRRGRLAGGRRRARRARPRAPAGEPVARRAAPGSTRSS